MERLGPLILGGAPLIGAIRKLINDSTNDGGETRVANLEKAMELQSALNDSIDVQLKIIQGLLEKVQRALKMLVIVAIGTAIIAGVALAIVLLK
jgi:predicted PurR-regulated permease PerM